MALPWASEIRYLYALYDDSTGCTRRESVERVLRLPQFLADEELVEVVDTWQDPSKPEHLLTRAAFTDVLLQKPPSMPAPPHAPAASPAKAALNPHASPKTGPVVAPGSPPALPLAPGEPPCPPAGEVLVRFQVQNLRLAEGQAMCVTGSVPVLGHWVKDQALALHASAGTQGARRGTFEADIMLPLTAFPFQFKFGIRAGPPSQPLHLERGPSRVLSLAADEAAGLAAKEAPVMLVASCGAFRYPQPWQGAGLAVPVFSLRSERSVGCGDFSDLREMVDFAESSGLRLIQVLPVNDTTVYRMWWDSYPYSCVSVHALHPLYLGLQDLVDRIRPPTPSPSSKGPLAPSGVEAAFMDQRALLMKQVATYRAQLDPLPSVDYEKTVEAKLHVARGAFELEGRAVLASEPFQRWFEESKEWLKPYVAFTILRDLFQTAEHWRWGDLAKPTAGLIDRFTDTRPGAEFAAKAGFAFYLQFQLHSQLKEAARYATARRVILKGDLPIGVDKRSVETWMEPHLFRMTCSTGAPPDYFDANGQNWGFPTYDWDAMERDGYRWFTRRMRHMGQYFQAYRLDHVLGFFRIWEVSPGFKSGVMGIFRPSVALWGTDLVERGLIASLDDADALDRLCEPFITGAYVEEVFGRPMVDEVVSRYLEELPGRGQGAPSTSGPTVRYRLRAYFDTEEKIHERIAVDATWPEDLRARAEGLRSGLVRMCQNRILLRDPEDPRRLFHPRFGLDTTDSFRALDPHLKTKVREVYRHYFFDRQEDLWRRTGFRRLQALMATSDMLMFGEDLGLIPSCVPEVLQDLGIVGLRIQRMPSEPNTEFGDPLTYPYLSVATPSCHDVLTTRAWWEEDAERRARFAFHQLGVLETPPEHCTTEVMRLILKTHMDSRAAWTIFPLQDILALSDNYNQRPAAEEVINDPTVAKHYWRYRTHCNISTLLADHPLLIDLQKLLVSSGRCTLQDLAPFYSKFQLNAAVETSKGDGGHF